MFGVGWPFERPLSSPWCAFLSACLSVGEPFCRRASLMVGSFPSVVPPFPSAGFLSASLPIGEPFCRQVLLSACLSVGEPFYRRAFLSVIFSLPGPFCRRAFLPTSRSVGEAFLSACPSVGYIGEPFRRLAFQSASLSVGLLFSRRAFGCVERFHFGGEPCHRRARTRAEQPFRSLPSLPPVPVHRPLFGARFHFVGEPHNRRAHTHTREPPF